MGRANDFFNLVNQNKLIGQQRKQFWGDYEYLNHQYIPEDNIIFKYQLSKLKTYQNSNGMQQRLDQLNNLINSIPPNQGDLIQEDIKEQSINNILIRILQILNKGLWGASGSSSSFRKEQIAKGNTTQESMSQDADTLVGELEQLLQLISFTSSEAHSIAEIARAGLLNSWSQKDFKFNNYAQWKARMAEEIIVKALQSNPNWVSIMSGQFYFHGQQLLQDALTFDTSINLEFGADLSFSIKQDGKIEKKTASSLEEFFKIINGLSSEYSVYLDDPLYDKLKELAVLKTQVKSGYGIQKILNDAMTRNAIPLSALGVEDPLVGLFNLFVLDWIDSNNTSDALIGYTNYLLSKSIEKTNLMGNDIYFTNQGFVTAYEWMDKFKYMLKFNPSISKITDGFWTIPRSYRLENL